METTRYPLGTNPSELERLRFQHSVWGGVTRAFLDRAGLAPGMRVLDVGCGPGFVTAEIAERVGPRGSVVALDESPLWIAEVERTITERRLANVRTMRARIEGAELEPASFDLVFARWVLSFVPDPAAAIARLARALRPGGVLAIEDYNHEGVSLFPDGAGFRAVVRATRELYRRAGGDAFVAGKLPALFRAAGLQTVAIQPNVLCGGPTSPAFRWAGLFFPAFSRTMQEKGFLTAEERELFLAEWAERESNPDALFFSPIVADAMARKPGR